jgi:hypothetical protein
LRKEGRSESAAGRCVRATRQFADYLQEQRGGRQIEDADAEDLDAFVGWIEREPKASAKGQLWALRYYFQFAGREEMEHLAGRLRRQRIETKPTSLKEFPGIEAEHLEALAAGGIRHAGQMMAAGRTPADRQALAEGTGVPPETILELVKLSDLSRLKGQRLSKSPGQDDARAVAGLDRLRGMARGHQGHVQRRIGGYPGRCRPGRGGRGWAGGREVL